MSLVNNINDTRFDWLLREIRRLGLVETRLRLVRFKRTAKLINSCLLTKNMKFSWERANYKFLADGSASYNQENNVRLKFSQNVQENEE